MYKEVFIRLVGAVDLQNVFRLLDVTVDAVGRRLGNVRTAVGASECSCLLRKRVRARPRVTIDSIGVVPAASPMYKQRRVKLKLMDIAWSDREGGVTGREIVTHLTTPALGRRLILASIFISLVLLLVPAFDFLPMIG